MSEDAPRQEPAPQIRLLRTKLFVPQPLPDLLARARLEQRLDDGAACRLTLISAPAGSGKTTLLSRWIQQRGLRAAWVSLDDSDNDPARFWLYVFSALEGRQPGIGTAALVSLGGAPRPPIEVILTELVNAASSLEARLTLVLDDYHAITTPGIHAALTFLLENLPPALRVIVATRQNPPLPLAALRARRQLLELTGQDLRFRPDEVGLWLNRVLGLGLRTEDVAALEARTAGWAAGLQLAALCLGQPGERAGQDVAQFIHAFTGSHRYVFDYLAQEVLERQPAQVRSFLLRTSVLDRMCAPLCDDLLGPETGGQPAQTLLEYLETANLFVVPLDGERRWYRYHPLFGDFLRARLEQEQGRESLRALSRRASRWSEANGYLEEAVQQALKAEDYAHAADLLDASVHRMFRTGELHTLVDWLHDLPASMLASRPRLGLAGAWASLASGHADEAERLLRAVEGAVGRDAEVLADPAAADALRPELRAALVEVTVIRGSIATGRFDLARGLELNRRVQRYLLDEGQAFVFNPPHYLRPPAVFNLAFTCELNGELTEAAAAYAEAAELARPVGNWHIVCGALGQLGRVQAAQGQLHQAAATYEQALAATREVADVSTPMLLTAINGLGALCYEWNDLPGALERLSEGAARSREWRNWEGMVTGYAGLARAKRALGDPTGARAAIDELARCCEQCEIPGLAGGGAALAALLLQEGDVPGAERCVQAHALAKSSPAGESGAPLYAREGEAILLARLRLAQGRYDEAEARLAALLTEAEAKRRMGRVIELTLLRALGCQARGESGQALRLLRHALVLAQPEGYIRTFLDEGPAVKELLARMRTENRSDDGFTLLPYVNLLLEASGAGPARVTSQFGVDTLSGRELEVLQLIASGASNDEIARQLVVSPNTVKTHIKNIYGKLGANNRTQAVGRAREIGLLA